MNPSFIFEAGGIDCNQQAQTPIEVADVLVDSSLLWLERLFRFLAVELICSCIGDGNQDISGCYEGRYAKDADELC